MPEREDLIPRIAVAATVVAAIVVYRQRRRGKFKKVQSSVASMPGEAAQGAKEAAGEISEHSQSMIESLLDNVAEQALKEVKGILKDGLKRIQASVDDGFKRLNSTVDQL